MGVIAWGIEGLLGVVLLLIALIFVFRERVGAWIDKNKEPGWGNFMGLGLIYLAGFIVLYMGCVPLAFAGFSRH